MNRDVTTLSYGDDLREFDPPMTTIVLFEYPGVGSNLATPYPKVPVRVLE
jgi:hypothetical protein